MLAYKLERAIPASLSQLQQHEAIRNIAAPPCSKSIVLQAIVKSGKTLVHHNGVSSALLQFTLTVYQHPFGLLAGGEGERGVAQWKKSVFPRTQHRARTKMLLRHPLIPLRFLLCVCVFFIHVQFLINKPGSDRLSNHAS